MPDSFMAGVAELVRLLPQIRELCTRQNSIQEAVVTNNNDPTGMRRIRVTREAQGGQSESDWIPCGRSTSYTDEPIPPVGTHCLIALVNGDPHNPFYLRTLSNATNPPDTGQLQPTNDNTVRIPGSSREVVEGDRTFVLGGEQSEEIGGDCYLVVKGRKYSVSAEFGEIILSAMATAIGKVSVEAAREIRLEQGGGYASLKEGQWIFANSSGQKWTLGGTGGQWIWDVGGGSIQVINCSGFSINGKQIIVVGSTDSGGDTNNTRGY